MYNRGPSVVDCDHWSWSRAAVREPVFAVELEHCLGTDGAERWTHCCVDLRHTHWDSYGYALGHAVHPCSLSTLRGLVVHRALVNLTAIIRIVGVPLRGESG